MLSRKIYPNGRIHTRAAVPLNSNTSWPPRSFAVALACMTALRSRRVPASCRHMPTQQHLPARRRRDVSVRLPCYTLPNYRTHVGWCHGTCQHHGEARNYREIRGWSRARSRPRVRDRSGAQCRSRAQSELRALDLPGAPARGRSGAQGGSASYDCVRNCLCDRFGAPSTGFCRQLSSRAHFCRCTGLGRCERDRDAGLRV